MSDLRKAMDGLAALAAIIERAPVDDVHLTKSLALAVAGEIRTVLAALAPVSAGDGVEAVAKGLREWRIEYSGGVITSGMAREMAACILRQPVFAALTRPRAAVGEQSREAVIQMLRDCADDLTSTASHHGQYAAIDQDKIDSLRDAVRDFDALQSPPAKVER